jgi:hypothetical protein
MSHIEYPTFARERGPLYWLRAANLWQARRKIFRPDASNRWRTSHHALLGLGGGGRSLSFSRLLPEPMPAEVRFAILGDTGEGDRSQYGLLPLLRSLRLHFLVLNGDLAYPAGNSSDYVEALFKPYRNLGIPIWAVPGNHEYYSKFKGREFFETFCSRHREAEWIEHGLRWVPQPGSYWELADDALPLVVIGVDTGQSGDLDGKSRDHDEDAAQHNWLQARLRAAQEKGRRVLVIFHIPALVNGRHVRETHLSKLHQILAAFSCVRLVVCGHVHNHQRYAAADFARFLGQTFGVTLPGQRGPEFVVSGGGGAYLSATDFKPGEYTLAEIFPTPQQWQQRIPHFVGLGKTLISRLVSRIHGATASDEDAAILLSFLLVTVTSKRTHVTPVFLEDLEALVPPPPGGGKLNVQDPGFLLTAQQLAKCVRRDLRLTL